MSLSSYPKRTMRRIPSSPDQVSEPVRLYEVASRPPHCRESPKSSLASPTRHPWIRFACLVVASHGQRAQPYTVQFRRAPQHFNRPAWKAFVVGDPISPLPACIAPFSSPSFSPFLIVFTYSLPCVHNYLNSFSLPDSFTISFSPPPPPVLTLRRLGAGTGTCALVDQAVTVLDQGLVHLYSPPLPF